MFDQRTSLIFFSTVLVVLGEGCSNEQTVAPNPVNQQLLATAPSPTPSPILLSPTPPQEPVASPSINQLSSYELGLDKAHGAYSISQSAQSSSDWQSVVTQWQDAIALLKAVPADHPNFPLAGTKIIEYQHQLDYARAQAVHPHPNTVVIAPKFTPNLPSLTPRPVITKSKQIYSPEPKEAQKSAVFAAPIKRTASGTPIIEVTFNGNQQFEMIVDTGASGTVITQKMADALGVTPVSRAKANTASAKSVIFAVGYLKELKVGGVVARNIPVAIAGAELETGLLGHDFFGDYDVTIKRDVVEFRPR